MTICPNTKGQCCCEPWTGRMCPYGPTPNDWQETQMTKDDVLKWLRETAADYVDGGEFSRNLLAAASLIESGAVEPTGWRAPITAPQDRDCLFSLRPLAKDDPYFVDTSGDPILGKGEPRVIITRYGRWSSLEVMTGWMPLPEPVNRNGDV